MSFRQLTSSHRALTDTLTSLRDRIDRIDRRANWVGAVRSASLEWPDGPIANIENMTNPGYPNFKLPTATLTLDPGRWVISFRCALSVAASDGGEVGMIGTAVFDATTATAPSRAGGVVAAVGLGDYFTLTSALEVSAVGTVTVTMPVYWGHLPLVDPTPYINGRFFNALIIAFPG